MDEVFISDGAKTDVACIQEIFGSDLKFAVADPVYPVYLDSNVMMGHTGIYNESTGTYDGVVYLPCTPENGFKAQPPKEKVDLVYLCSPSNPTGTAMSTEELKKWVDYAKENKVVLIYDSAYETYITERMFPIRFMKSKAPKKWLLNYAPIPNVLDLLERVVPMSSFPMP